MGILRHGPFDKTVGSIGALRQGLRELGYVEGQTIALEYRFSGQKVEVLPAQGPALDGDRQDQPTQEIAEERR